MKKVLIASTALVAAGLLTTGTASASEKIKLELGGFSKWWVVGQWQDKDFESNLNTVAATASSTPASGLSATNVDVKGDNEIHFNGSTTLDNGIKVGVRVELEAGGHTETNTGVANTMDVIDESYAYVETGFGKVMVGTYNNGTYLLHVSAPDAAGNWGEAAIMTGGLSVVKPGAVSGMLGGNTTAIATDGDAEKITYVAPSFYGLTLGASYVPNAFSEDNRGVAAGANGPNAGAGALASTPLATDSSAYGVGALYANTFGGVGVKLSGGWVTYQVKSNNPIAGGSDMNNEYSAGAQLSYAGFTLGGSYRQTNLNNATSGVGVLAAQAGQANLAGGVTSTAANGGIAASEGRAFDLGLQYASGPYAVSFAYFNSSVNGIDGNGGRDTITFYQVSGKYTLGAGVDLLASAGYADYKNEGTDVAGADANNNKGWAVMTGLSLAF
ncbi:MAG: porin [Solirubrobacterales bacterium]